MAIDLVFCGTYTDPSRQAGFEVTPDRPVMGMTGPTGSEGIYIFRHHRESGSLTLINTARGVVNPTFLSLDASERFLFAVNEVCEFGGEASGAVSSFAIDRETGALRFLSQVASGGGNPCHLSMSHCGRFLMVANHEAGSVAVFPVAEDGKLSDRIDLHIDEPKDHRRAHAHFITSDPDGAFVLSSDTGTDRVMIYRQDNKTGKLTPNNPAWGETHSGGSPRHLAFSPNGRYLFANGEADLTLSVFRYNPVRGVLDHIQHLPTVPEGIDTQQLSTAQMLVHPSGRLVFVANRGTNTIAIFRFDENAEQAAISAFEPTRGKTPRNFQIDPTGRWLYVANQNSNSIECFVIDQENGRLLHKGTVAAVPAPTCIQFTAT